jgi:hypothetical protein
MKSLISTFTFLIIINNLFSQNLTFSFEVVAVSGQDTKVIAYLNNSSSTAERIAGFSLAFYYNGGTGSGTSTATSWNIAPINSIWPSNNGLASNSLGTIGMGTGVSIQHNRFANITLIDNTNVGYLVPGSASQIPLLELNFTNNNPSSQGWLANTSNYGSSLIYYDQDFNEYPINVSGLQFAPLPIKLSSFSAVKDGDRSARLDWTSASEVNSAYFGIERSTDGINWQAIDRVAAAGNSSSKLDYQYYDRNLPISRSNDHIFYYRLQLVDLDGQYKYSDVRGVNFEGIASTDVISLYPNPTTSMVNIDLRDMDIEQGSIHLTVVDMAGRLIINKTINGNGIEPIDVSRYDAGSYQVLVTQGSQQHQKRFIKAN